MLNINLFAGPGTGKSTTAAGLFAAMKAEGHKVELLQEYAKDLTYGKDHVKLSDQLYVMGKQHHKLFRLDGVVDYVIHDSPFIMGLLYLDDTGKLDRNLFTAMAIDLHSKYNNLNILLKRSSYHPYQEYGRGQSYEEAVLKDIEISQFLTDNSIPFIEIEVGEKTLNTILQKIKEL